MENILPNVPTTIIPVINRNYNEIKSRQKIFTINNNIPQPSTIFEHSFRCYYILEEVKEMLKRGDSNETILKIISYLDN